MMSHLKRFIQLPQASRIFLCSLAVVYALYLVGLAKFLYPMASPSTETIVEHVVYTPSAVVLGYWTVTTMQNATDADQSINASDFTQVTSDLSKGKAEQQQGQLPRNKNVDYPLSTVGKIFFTNASGQNMVCSGTAVVSSNHSTVDSAGHCLYWNGAWVKNLIFCPLYANGDTPFGCWAARDLEVPADWITPRPNDYHHDMGMAIVSANSEGLLTDVVGGVGWAYNQSVTQPFYAYGYPAAYPFDGQTRQSCENAAGKSWQHGAGTVISIPCNMTGGSSGGPWFMKSGDNRYLNGHNDFISSIQPGHMFSPYYDDTWHDLYVKAQNT